MLEATPHFWTTDPPALWPDPPSVFSFSTYHAIESCPRRWALATASYPSLWSGAGYPRRASLGAMQGTVIHQVVESLSRELAQSDCDSVHDASTFDVLRKLGGLSTVINTAIDGLTADLSANPRTAHLTEYYSRALRTKTPEIRSSVQSMLSIPRFELHSREPRNDRHRLTNTALGNGDYVELSLYSALLGWKGRVDLLMLRDDSCEIIDFKSGHASKDHIQQLTIYALLWSQDKRYNPNGRLATKLTLVYPTGAISVPAPTIEQLEEIEKNLIEKTDSARLSAQANPPQAKPSPKQCIVCHVRHLCTRYWEPNYQEQMFLASQEARSSFVDIEGHIQRKHGPNSWWITVSRGCSVQSGLLFTNGKIELKLGRTVRILGAVRAFDDKESFSLSVLSEVFVTSPVSR